MEKLARKRKRASAEQNDTNLSITDGVQPDENLIGRKRRGRSAYTLESVMQSLALKLYPEQITGYDADHAEELGYDERLIQQLR